MTIEYCVSCTAYHRSVFDNYLVNHVIDKLLQVCNSTVSLVLAINTLYGVQW